MNSGALIDCTAGQLGCIPLCHISRHRQTPPTPPDLPCLIPR